MRTVDLLDLDDGVLVDVFGRFDPKPDLFQISLVCKRFRNLATDGRLWLRVGGEGSSRRTAVGHRNTAHLTLKDAICSSRPGDTIVLDSGMRHVADDLSVEWPLRIMGAGETPEETRLVGQAGGSSAIDFRASGVLSNISVLSHQSTCITHTQGKLLIDRCALSATPSPGLEHLFTPIVTTAISPPSKRRRLDAEGQWLNGSEAQDPCGSEWQQEPLVAMRGGSGGASGQLGLAAIAVLDGQRKEGIAMPGLRKMAGGMLLVKETKIRGGGGMRAVHTKGTGLLSGVRVINFEDDSLFWFEVDSQRSVKVQQTTVTRERPQLPSWALSNLPMFPPGPLGEAHWRPDEASGAPDERSQDLRLKARSWDERCARGM